MGDISKHLEGNELPIDFMEPKAFARTNDNDWRRMQDKNANAEATQRSIAISLKRLADVADQAWDWFYGRHIRQ